MEDLEEARAFLQKDSKGANLYEHISEVLLQILTLKPEDPLQVFEQISAAVKQEKFVPHAVEGKLPEDLPDTVSAKKAQQALSKVLAAFHLSAQEGEENEDGEKELIEPPSTRAEVVDDIVLKSQFWEAAGVSFGKETTYHLLVSLAQLAGSDENIETLRLWGKVLGRESNYFVAEGTVASQEEEEGAEPEANQYTYWACPHLGAKWEKLPLLKPESVLVAKQIRKFFTGNLDSDVSAYPPFPGKERDFLRATIALINADCAIAPKGYFKVEEDSNGVSIDEEFTAEEKFNSSESWETFGLKFNELGRVTAKEEEDEEGNPINKPEGWEVEWLRPCGEEEWVLRASPSVLPASKSEHSVMKSLRWPGAYGISSTAGTWTNIYVGYGYPKAEESYTPPMPPPLQGEFDTSALVEQADVTEDPTPPEEALEEDE